MSDFGKVWTEKYLPVHEGMKKFFSAEEEFDAGVEINLASRLPEKLVAKNRWLFESVLPALDFAYKNGAKLDEWGAVRPLKSGAKNCADYYVSKILDFLPRYHKMVAARQDQVNARSGRAKATPNEVSVDAADF